MATIYDIAAKAGVSSSTVSRALNESRLVSDEVRERIHRIAKDLGFEKRVIRRHRQRTILNIRLVLPRFDSPEQGLFYDVSQLINGIQKGFLPTSINVVCDLAGPSYIPFLHKKGGDTDAFIFAFHLPSDETIAIIKDRNIPFVVLNRSKSDLPCITSDHADGMEKLVDHLITTPIKPCLIMVHGLNDIFDERRAELTTALTKKGIPFSDADIFIFDDISSIKSDALIRISETYDTLICINDIIGSVVLSLLSCQGISVPDACQVTGFDNSPLRNLTRPLLTSVSMPVFEFGERAGKKLAEEVIEGIPTTLIERIQGTLLIGESTRHPK